MLVATNCEFKNNLTIFFVLLNFFKNLKPAQKKKKIKVQL